MCGYRRRDIVVGTPGRLLALLHASSLALSAVSAFVLDEADRLLTGSMYDATAEIYEQLPRRKQVRPPPHSGRSNVAFFNLVMYSYFCMEQVKCN